MSKIGQRKKVGSTATVDEHSKENASVTSLPDKPSFEREIDSFVLNVEGLSRAYHQTMKVVTTSAKELVEAFLNFLEEKGVVTTTEGGKAAYQIKPADLRFIKKQSKDISASSIAVMKIPQIFFCSLVHQYDAFLGRMLRVAFYLKPETLNSSQKQMTFSDLMSFNSLDEAREHMIEKEIESIIRDNHDDQFTLMENRFGLALRKDLPAWPAFIEMTERRNLFVHCDGVVSSQYLSVCQKHGVSTDKELRPGEPLHVTREYFEGAVDCILEIGVKLGHVLWRKLQPNQLAAADNSLHRITYDLLLDEKYLLAKTLLHFASNILKKHSSESMHRMNLINLAIAHYHLDEKPKANQLIDSQDWSACEDKFKLAVAVLRDDYPGAEKLMKKIGKKGEVTREDYSSWPLFRTFRESREFLRTYKKLFGTDFLVPKEDIEQGLNTEENQQVVPPDR